MEKAYNPNSTEQRIYKYWEENNLFAPKGSGDPFCIVIPPPNVTGALHIGHALDNTLQDILTRYKRLQGFDALWIPGTDHAGIATQNVVEKKLMAEGITRHDLGREAFIEKVWEWKKEYGTRITTQLRRLGASVDWNHERFTMDEGCSKAVRKVFVSLFKEGLIYQGNYITNWCPRCHTALSDVEVEHADHAGSFWHYKYPFVDGSGFIEIATTRPETMFGDTAVAVNPDDKRYKDKIGKMLKIPFSGREIPVIADDYVDPEFGSGAVKITPAHDPNDYAMGKRHDLEFIKIMDESAVMNHNAPKQYQGMDRYECRKQLVADLEEAGLLIEVKEHNHSVGGCYRCKTTIEPYLSKQWFVSMKELVEPTIKAVKDGTTEFMPGRWSKAFFAWQENIRDWCVSRQIWWGHRIPVWYCECGEIICEDTDPTVCPKCGNADIKQDEDVLDTWFSSALWPFETLGWPDKTADVEKFYPTSVLVTGYDIITFWVTRMMTMGMKFMGKVPFPKVLIHGLVRDSKGAKMSKSTGNAIDPIEVMDEHGTDALRFALASLSTSGGQDIKLSDDKIISSRNFANKIWNVCRFVLMSYQENPVDLTIDESKLDIADKWILSKYNRTLKTVGQMLDNFEFGASSAVLYQFVWNDFCDWYVEFSKHRKQDAMPVLVHVMTGFLKMLHPMMPFITEELWNVIAGITKAEYKPLITSEWAIVDESMISDEVEANADIIVSIIHAIRNTRADVGIKPSVYIKALYNNAGQSEIIESQKEYVLKLARVESLELVSEKPSKSLFASAGQTEIYIPAEDILDIDAELARLNKKLDKLAKEIKRLEGKLGNQKFVANAPAEVVAIEKEKLLAYKEESARFEKQLSNLK